MTAMAEKLRSAGVKSSADRLREIALEVARDVGPRDEEARSAFIGRIQNDSALLYELTKAELPRLVRPYLADAFAEERSARGQRCHDDQSMPAPRSNSPGGHFDRDPRAQSAASPSPVREKGGRSLAAPTSAQVKARSAAVSKVVERRFMDFRRIDGKPIGDFTGLQLQDLVPRKKTEAAFVAALAHDMLAWPQKTVRDALDDKHVKGLYDQAEKANA